MKLARFDAGNGPELGVIVEDAVVALTRALPQLSDDMIALIRAWPDQANALAQSAATGERLALGSVRLLPPIARPGKILALGLNYADHVKESGHETPKHQVWFCKHNNSINGPRDPVQVPKASAIVDYEVELVVVIGSGGKHLTGDAAKAAVFGYCVGNDFSVRDWQVRTPQWMLGKSFDTHGPFGPWITTADEIGDPHRLGIRCSVNGELRQNSNTRELIFSVWDQIEHLTEAMTLSPGDILFTGTPAGVGAGMKPMTWLKAGDVVRAEIDELGAIENIMEPEL